MPVTRGFGGFVRTPFLRTPLPKIRTPLTNFPTAYLTSNSKHVHLRCIYSDSAYMTDIFGLSSNLSPNPPSIFHQNHPLGSSSFVSFTQCSPTCGRMPLPSLSLWPGRQPCRPRLVGDMRGGGPSSVAPRSRNPPTGHRRYSPISSLLFSHGQPLCAVG